MKKKQNNNLILKNSIAIFISMITIYLINIRDWLALAFVSLTVLICLMVYLNYEVLIHYKKKRNKLEIRHLFFISTASATVMLISFPFYFSNNPNLTFGIVIVVSFITFIWSTIELIKEEFK